MINLRATIAGTAVMALLAGTMTATPAAAWHRRGPGAGAIAGAVVGGMALGAVVGAMSAPRYYGGYGYSPYGYSGYGYRPYYGYGYGW